MKENKKEYYDEEAEVLAKAMLKAQQAFEHYFKEQDLDATYFALYLTGYKLDMDFRKLEEISMCLNRTGHEKFKYEDKKDEPINS